MEKDVIYVFDKETKKGINFGEIQSDFNMSFVIDGTKDSCQLIAMNYDAQEIEPYSIVLHKKTMTWWVVSHDKIERRANENGFIYIHNLELLGAVELLNARDLTDCGFNANYYTLNDVIYRLFALSNINDYIININADSNFRNKILDYVKSFENYTLLSALREILDAYNSSCNVTFNATYNSAQDTYTLSDLNINIIYKTGNYNSVHQISEFEDVRETKTMDKNSFGTTVVTNAENVIASTEKRFPSIGGSRLSSTEYKISYENAILRLPSKVYQGLWLKMYFPLRLQISYIGTGDSQLHTTLFKYYASNINSITSLINAIVDFVPNYIKDAVYNDLISEKDTLKSMLDACGTITFYEGNKLEPYYGPNNDQPGTIIIKKGDDVPYLAELYNGYTKKQTILTDKDTKNLLTDKKQGIAWQRGSDTLTGFDFYDGFHYIEDTSQTDYGSAITYFYSNLFSGTTVLVRIPQSTTGIDLGEVYESAFAFKYIPMSDLKVKVDNQRTKKDIQLYNQNGKLTDCFALSKMLNSYSKEISSNTITRYMQYYSLTDIPKVGDVVINGDEDYVINNISYTFTQNESNVDNTFNYFIDCEITMSKYISTKSLMVNPNSNIRDYGIPQNFNVKRKQLYRDYYEINYQLNDDNEANYLLNPQNVFTFSHEPNTWKDFVAVIKLGYGNAVDGSTQWYYQLETTNYYLDKMFYIVVDFNDNNIIGYGSQNASSGFVISRILTGFTDGIVTPISYVDEEGRFDNIDLLLLESESLEDIYEDYLEDVGSSNYQGNICNYSIFIDQYIYDAALGNYTIRIKDDGYYKDAIEVPVFEYSCQIDDSNDVLIGDKILKQYDGNVVYFYSYVKGHNLNQNNVRQTNRVTANTSSPLGWHVNDGATIEYEDYTDDTKLIKITTFLSQFMSLEKEWENFNRQEIELGYDYAIFRHTFNLTTQEEIIDLLFIAKNVPYTNVTSQDVLVLQLNHYKLN